MNHENINNQLLHFTSFKKVIMKNFKIITLSLTILSVCVLSGCFSKKTDNNDFIIEDITDKYEAVSNYNDTLRELTSECINSQNEIMNLYTDENQSINNIQEAIDDSLDRCQNILSEINTLGDREWDSSLKEWIITVIDIYMEYYTKFSDFIPYSKIDNPAPEEAETLERIINELNAIEDKLWEANDKLAQIQENFANEHWYTLEY